MMFFFYFFLLAASCGLSVGIAREYIYVEASVNVTWSYAVEICQTSYKDIAIATNAEEQKKLAYISSSRPSTWVGLRKENGTENNWTWVNGPLLSNLNWPSDKFIIDTLNHEKKCAYLDNGTLYNDLCNSARFFYCNRYLILVNESKTWNEAHQYCARHHTCLASLPSKAQQSLAKSELVFSQTDSVWASLYFMSGQWFWLSGERETLLPMPSCPAKPYYCGAVNKNTYVWENHDCNEKRNFLCYWG